MSANRPISGDMSLNFASRPIGCDLTCRSTSLQKRTLRWFTSFSESTIICSQQLLENRETCRATDRSVCNRSFVFAREAKTHTSAQILRKHEAHEENGAGAGLADAAISAEAPQERMYCILPQNTANANWEREYRTKSSSRDSA